MVLGGGGVSLKSASNKLMKNKYFFKPILCKQHLFQLVVSFFELSFMFVILYEFGDLKFLGFKETFEMASISSLPLGQANIHTDLVYFSKIWAALELTAVL